MAINRTAAREVLPEKWRERGGEGRRRVGASCSTCSSRKRTRNGQLVVGRCRFQVLGAGRERRDDMVNSVCESGETDD